MKVLKEWPRDFVKIAPKSLYKRKRRSRRKNTAFYIVKKLLTENPEGVYEVDCQPSQPEKHPRQCSVQVDMARLNAIGALPRRLVGYHTRQKTFVFWMESENEEK